jgi:gliding motility-associated-like protein
VHPLPVISLSPVNVTQCEKASALFVDNSTTNAGATYDWNFGDGTTSDQVSPVHDYTSSGTYTINVIVTSPYGCTNTASTTSTIIVLPGTVAEFSSIANDGSTISPMYQFVDHSLNASTYFWTFGDGATSTTANPSHTYADKGTYTVSLLTITNQGCRDSIQKTVEIAPVFTLYIPNAFTPDGNGSNDFFAPKGSEINEFKMMIFDRWGEMIFSTEDINKGWDGTANHGEKIAEQGVYVYKIEVRDFHEKYHDYTGHVTLLASNE